MTTRARAIYLSTDAGDAQQCASAARRCASVRIGKFRRMALANPTAEPFWGHVQKYPVGEKLIPPHWPEIMYLNMSDRRAEQDWGRHSDRTTKELECMEWRDDNTINWWSAFQPDFSIYSNSIAYLKRKRCLLTTGGKIAAQNRLIWHSSESSEFSLGNTEESCIQNFYIFYYSSLFDC